MSATFAQPAAPPTDPLSVTLTATIRLAAAIAPRSLQSAIGPSEVGTPCTRRLAYRWLGVDPVGLDGDPLASIIGTATHSWLAAAFTRANALLNRQRWLVEQPVTIRPGLTGSVDLYDTDNDTIVDWKIVGKTSLDAYRRNGPRPQYVTQAHLYGMGLSNAGHTPRNVALAFLPRAGWLGGMWTWTAPYDPAVAEAALDRLDGVAQLVAGLDVETHDDRWASIPAQPGSECRFCPWWAPARREPGLAGCPGGLP